MVAGLASPPLPSPTDFMLAILHRNDSLCTGDHCFVDKSYVDESGFSKTSRPMYDFSVVTFICVTVVRVIVRVLCLDALASIPARFRMSMTSSIAPWYYRASDKVGLSTACLQPSATS